MTFGKRKLLAAFLEKDNVKLLAYEINGRNITRTFGGQLSFGADVLREAFIADPLKFASQIKLALTQKPEAAGVSEAVLFIPAEKTFIKAMPVNDAIESFVRTLPYFKEELLITEGEKISGSSDDSIVNHLAFEKKLVEDFERPFLESGKKVVSAISSVKTLANSFSQSGKYFLMIQFDRETVVLAMQDSVILDMATFPKDVWPERMNEFRLGKNFSDIKTAFSLGVFDPGALDKVRNAQQLSVSEIESSDVYDLVLNSYIKEGKSGNALPVNGLSLDFASGIKGKLPDQKILFLVGAAVVGFVLVIVLAKNLTKFSLPKFGGNGEAVKKTTSAPKAELPPPPPAPKPADFKVRVLNGTTVTGEAGRAGDAIKTLGFDVVETKNATASGFVATRVRTTADVPQEIVDQLKTSLLSTYESVNVETLTDDLVKIEVIVGKKK